MPFIAQCPECRTAFRISHGQLRAADGLVRCGACLQVFSAQDHRVLLQDGQAEMPASEAGEFIGPPLPPALEETVELEAPAQASAEDPPAAAEAPEPEAAASEDEADGATEHAFVLAPEAPAEDRAQAHEGLRELRDEDGLEALDTEALESIGSDPLELQAGAPPARLRRRLPLLFANLALLLLLGAQFAWTHFERLAGDPRLRPALERFCGFADCSVPPRRDLAAIRSQQLVVHSHPSVAGVLQVDFIFRNEAPFPQRFPLVELNFFDSGNRLLAGRRFKPGEYLAPELRQFENMPPGSPVQVSLEIVDPGAEAVNYSLSFHSP